ncbi:hypothetical protein E6O75_ATG01919 [Venturia nashicola]|uniref:FAR1 domain-containing protein n=1 Tax=Venturia nashicola TaxID=86259 RepID=A0A4Z1P3Y6_9PEZI|nr:hypothetical protein E6O75_ATG01919 [Venturia nashicola]
MAAYPQQIFYPAFPQDTGAAGARPGEVLQVAQTQSTPGVTNPPPNSFPPHVPYGNNGPLSQEQVSMLQRGIRPRTLPPNTAMVTDPNLMRPQQSNSSALRGQKQQRTATNGHAGPHVGPEGEGPDSGAEDEVEMDGDEDPNAQLEGEAEGAEEDNTPPEGMYYLAPPPPRTYDSLEDTLQALHEWNKDHGFDVSKQKPMKNKAGDIYKYLYRCTRHGRLDNNRKLTDDTRKRKRRSGKTGCPMGLYIRAVNPADASGKWAISYQRDSRSKFHNHEGVSAEDLTGHRRRHRTEEMVDIIRQQRAAGMDAAQTLAYIKERLPGALITKQDILNYRRADPGPNSDNTNYLDKPYLLCLSFLQDFEVCDKYGQELLQRLRTKLPVSVCTKLEQFQSHFLKNPPRVILVTDPAMSYPAYRLQLARLLTYCQDGGTVVFLAHFSNTPAEYINLMFKHHFNLPWEISDNITPQTNFRLNENLEAGGSGGRYTVIARNFAPGTDISAIQGLVGISSTAGQTAELLSCRIYSQKPTVVAELVFATQEGAESVINSFSGKSVNLGRIATAEGKELHFALRTPAPMGTSDLAPSTFIHAKALGKVEPEHSVYIHCGGLDVFGNWNAQLPPGQQVTGLFDTAASYCKIGKGFMGYMGQLEYDDNYLRTVAAMCHF